MGLLSWFGLSRWKSKEEEQLVDHTECDGHEDATLKDTGRNGRGQPRNTLRKGQKSRQGRASSRNGSSTLRVTIAKKAKKSGRLGASPVGRGGRRQGLRTDSVVTDLKGKKAFEWYSGSNTSKEIN
eukprot:jgi/Picre1/32306/NNA_007652.t1